jgi:phosphomannomutase
VTTRDVLDDYVEHVMSFIDPSIIKPFNVVLDAGSGMAGLVAPKLFDRLPCKTTRLCFEIDGTFPEPRSQPADRGEPPRHRRARDREKADIGIAWDGDADRCFFIDGTGEFISGDFVTALLAEAFLLKHPGATIIYDLRASYAVRTRRREVRRHGADEPRRPRVLQARMRETNASSAARSPGTTTSATTSTPTTASSRRC